MAEVGGGGLGFGGCKTGRDTRMDGWRACKRQRSALSLETPSPAHMFALPALALPHCFSPQSKMSHSLVLPAASRPSMRIRISLLPKGERTGGDCGAKDGG